MPDQNGYPTFQDYIEGGRAPPLPQDGPEATGTGNWFTSGVGSGFYEALANVGRAGQAVAKGLGANDAATAAGAYAARQQATAQSLANPDYENDPWSLGGVGYRLAQGVPTFLGAAAVGSIAALGAPPEAAGVAGVAGARGLLGWLGSAGGRSALGATAAIYPQAVGENVQRTQQDNGDLTQGQSLKALALGVPEAALQGILPAKLEGRLVTGVGGSLASRITRGAAEGVAIQGGVGGASEFLLQQMGDPNRSFADRANGIVQAALGGALQGGVFGALAALPAKHVTTDQLLQVTSSIDPAARQLPAPRPIPSDQQVTPARAPTGLENVPAEKLNALHEYYQTAKTSGQDLPADHAAMADAVAQEVYRRNAQGPQASTQPPETPPLRLGDDVVRAGPPADMRTRPYQNMPDMDVIRLAKGLSQIIKTTNDPDAIATGKMALDDLRHEMSQRAGRDVPMSVIDQMRITASDNQQRLLPAPVQDPNAPPPMPTDPEAPPPPPAPERQSFDWSKLFGDETPINWPLRRQELAKGKGNGVPRVLQGKNFDTEEAHQRFVLEQLKTNPTESLERWAQRAGIDISKLNEPEKVPLPPGISEEPTAPVADIPRGDEPTAPVADIPRGDEASGHVEVPFFQSKPPEPSRQELGIADRLPDVVKFSPSEDLTPSQELGRHIQQVALELGSGQSKPVWIADLRAKFPNVDRPTFDRALAALHSDPASGFQMQRANLRGADADNQRRFGGAFWTEPGQAVRAKPAVLQQAVQHTEVPALQSGVAPEARAFVPQAQTRVAVKNVREAAAKKVAVAKAVKKAPPPKTQQEAIARKGAVTVETPPAPPTVTPDVERRISDVIGSLRDLSARIDSVPATKRDGFRKAVETQMRRLDEVMVRAHSADPATALSKLSDDHFMGGSTNNLSDKTFGGLPDYAINANLSKDLTARLDAHSELEEKVIDAIRRAYKVGKVKGEEIPSLRFKSGREFIANLPRSDQLPDGSFRARPTVTEETIAKLQKIRNGKPTQHVARFRELQGVLELADHVQHLARDNSAFEVPELPAIYTEISRIATRMSAPKRGEHMRLSLQVAALREHLDAVRDAQATARKGWYAEHDRRQEWYKGAPAREKLAALQNEVRQLKAESDARAKTALQQSQAHLEAAHLKRVALAEAMEQARAEFQAKDKALREYWASQPPSREERIATAERQRAADNAASDAIIAPILKARSEKYWAEHMQAIRDRVARETKWQGEQQSNQINHAVEAAVQAHPLLAASPQTHRLFDLIQTTNSGKEVLDYLTKHASTPFIQSVARLLSRFGVDPTVRFANDTDFETHIPEGMFRPGSYNPALDRVNVYSTDNLETTLLHELFHAATVHAYEKNPEWTARLNKLFDDLVSKTGKFPKSDMLSDVRGFYGLENAREMLSEYVSNPRFRDFMDTTEMPQTKGQKIGAFISDMISRLLGMPRAVLRTLNSMFRSLRGYAPEDEQVFGPKPGTSYGKTFGQALRELTPDLVEANREARTTSSADEEIPSYRPNPDFQSTSFAAQADRAMRSISDAADHVRAMTPQRLMQDLSDSSLNLRETARKYMLGWVDGSHIASVYGHLVSAIPKFMQLQRDQADLKDVLARSSVATNRVFQALPHEAQGLLNRVMARTAQRIDATKSFADQPHLHNVPGAAAEVAAANAEYAALKRVPGGADAYEMIRAKHDAEYKASMLVSLKMLADQFDGGIPGVRNVLQDYMQQTAIHDNPVKSAQYFSAALEDHIAAAEKFRDTLGATRSELSDKLKSGQTPLEEVAGTTTRIKRLTSDRDYVNKMLDGIKQKLKDSQESPYFHLGRRGSHFVTGNLFVNPDNSIHAGKLAAFQKRLIDAGFDDVALMSATGNSRIYARVRSASEMNALRMVFEKAQKDGLLYDKDPVAAGEASDAKLFDSISPEFMRRMMEKYRATGPMYPEGADEATIKAVKDSHYAQMRDMQNALLDMLPETAVGRLMARREYVQGFSRDMFKSSQEASASMTASLSRLSLTTEVGRALAEMREQVKKNNSDPKFSTNDRLASSQAVAELMMRERLRQTYTPPNPLDGLRHLTHMLHIGSSPAYFLTLMSQMGTTSLPELAKTHGFMRSAQEMFNVTNDAFRIIKAIATSQDWATAGISQAALEKAKIPPALVKFVMDGAARGNYGSSAYSSQMMAGSEHGPLGHGVGKTFKDAMNMIGLYAELTPRLVTGLAARNLYRTNPEKAVVKGQKLSESEFVAHVIRESQGDWTTSLNARQTTRGGMFGAMSPMVNQFMGWQIKMTGKLYREAAGALGGDRQSQVWMMAHLGAVTMLAGTLGLPLLSTFASVYDRLADMLTDRDDHDLVASYRTFLANTFGRDVGEVIARGAPRALGMDFDHWGEGNIVPGSAMINALTEKRKFEDAEKDWLKSMGGSALGTVTNYVSGLRDMTNFDFLDGSIKMVPEFLKTPLEGYRLAQRGFVDKNGAPLPITANAFDVALTAMGIDPAKEAEYNEVKREQIGLNTMRQLNAGNITRHLVMAQERGDQQMFQQWEAASQRYMQEHPGMEPPIANFGRAFAEHVKAATLARAINTPIGVAPRDIAGRGMLSYGNFSNR